MTHLAGLFNLLLIISGALSLILFAIDPSTMVNVRVSMFVAGSPSPHPSD